MAYFQTLESSSDRTGVGGLFGFRVKVANYKDSSIPVRCTSALKMLSFISCYQLIKNNPEQGA